MEEIVQKQQYITRKKDSKNEGRRKNTRKKKREKGGRNTTVKMKGSSLSIVLTGHVRECFLYVCMCDSFHLTLYINIFILDLDQLFLSLSTNLQFGLFGLGSIPVLGSSQNQSLQLLFLVQSNLVSKNSLFHAQFSFVIFLFVFFQCMV